MTASQTSTGCIKHGTDNTKYKTPFFQSSNHKTKSQQLFNRESTLKENKRQKKFEKIETNVCLTKNLGPKTTTRIFH